MLIIQNFFGELLSNRVLIAGVVGWLVAQVLKFIIHTIVNKQVDITRLFGDGGMPSCHSSTVTCMATTSLLVYGPASFEFALSGMLAIIVMHDAMGVRLETGKQAKVIKEIAMFIEHSISLTTNFSDEKLKEFVGHTPLQVFFGAMLGIIIACVLYF